jgi:8-oxo-dGTP pyrophosphatase MutT (NUDIX family)
MGGPVTGETMADGTLHADTVATLTAFAATSAEAAEARRRTLELLRAGPVAMTRAHRAGHVTASTLVTDPDGRILLCLHGRLGMWMQLGGHCEAGDTSLADAALREAIEESGITGLWLPPEPIDVDVHPVRCAVEDGGPAAPSVHFDVRFVAVCPAGAVERVSAESAALGWFSPDALPSPLADGVVRQIAPALARLAEAPAAPQS